MPNLSGQNSEETVNETVNDAGTKGRLFFPLENKMHVNKS